MTTTKTRFLALAAATTLGLTLASCSSSDSTDDTTTDGGAVAETDDAVDTETGDAETGDSGGTAASGPDCLIGTWEITEESLAEQTAATLGDGVEVDVTGGASVTFDESTVRNESDSSSTFSGDIEGVELSGSSTANGFYTVEYTADDSSISLGELVEADGGTTVEQTVAGQTQELEISFEESAGLLGQISQDYECSDSELTLTTEVAAGGGAEGAGEPVAVSVTYTRA